MTKLNNAGSHKQNKPECLLPDSWGRLLLLWSVRGCPDFLSSDPPRGRSNSRTSAGDSYTLETNIKTTAGDSGQQFDLFSLHLQDKTMGMRSVWMFGWQMGKLSTDGDHEMQLNSSRRSEPADLESFFVIMLKRNFYFCAILRDYREASSELWGSSIHPQPCHKKMSLILWLIQPEYITIWPGDIENNHNNSVETADPLADGRSICVKLKLNCFMTKKVSCRRFRSCNINTNSPYYYKIMYLYI